MTPLAPPIEPMLAKVAEAVPEGAFLYEPKWDGFRAIVFRDGAELYIQSRDLKPLDRYFPELHDALLERLPERCVVDGEIVIATADGLDFDALQMRLHPAASPRGQAGRRRHRRRSSPSICSALGGEDLRDRPSRSGASGSSTRLPTPRHRCISRR